MRWTFEEWENCSAEVIKNYFTHCLKHDLATGKDVEKEVEQKTFSSIEWHAAQHGVVFTKAILKNHLIASDEINVVDEASYSELVREAAGFNEKRDEEECTKDQENAREDVKCVEDKLRALAIARSVIEQHGLLFGEVSKVFLIVRGVLDLRGRAVGLRKHFSTTLGRYRLSTV